MWVYTGVGYANKHVTTYTSFTVDADQTSVHQGDTVTFTPKIDGASGPAARWRWAPDDTSSDRVACPAGVTNCKKGIHGAGTMWAYTADTGADSTSKHISVLPRRKLALVPSDTVWVEVGTTVTYVASAQGAAILNPHWSGSDATIIVNRAPNDHQQLSQRSIIPRDANRAIAGASNSTCVDGVITCQETATGVYVRTITATVDDSLQTQSVTVVAGYIDHPGPDDQQADGGSGPCPSCQKADSLKKINIDSVMKRMDTTSTQCSKARAELDRYLTNDWVYTFVEKTAKWGRWSPADYDPIWNTAAWHPWIELSTALWTTPGKKVLMGKTSSGIPIIVTVSDHRMEQTIVHESLHAAGFDHDSADQFRSTTLKACMNANSRIW